MVGHFGQENVLNVHTCKYTFSKMLFIIVAINAYENGKNIHLKTTRFPFISCAHGPDIITDHHEIMSI